MGNLFSLLTTFNGRINRAIWWLGLVLLGVANVLGGMLLNPEFFTAEEPPPPSWPDTVWQIALLYPLTAITVKRFKDADRPAWLGYWFAPFGVALISARTSASCPARSNLPRWRPAPCRFVYFLFAFIDNGFVRGTEGPNRYGPDPLARSVV